jgi:trans-aconitate 2-methyltransferase
VDVWETTYWQRLVGEAPVLEWLRGTTLVPYLERLDAARQARFCAELGTALDAAYPAEADGSVLFPFRRIFLVARR